jgi:hypothetical protein
MNAALASLVSTLLVVFRSRLALQAEILALRHQLNVLRRSAGARSQLRTSDRVFGSGAVALNPPQAFQPPKFRVTVFRVFTKCWEPPF